MSSVDNVYSKGDWIVHANYGVGQVKGKDNKSLEGVKKTFLKVKTFNSIYWLPVTGLNVDHIRPLASKYQINRALTLIRKAPKEMDKDHKQRTKAISEAFADVSLYTKARMIRDLNARRITVHLNQSEVDAFDKMKKQLLNEWSVISEADMDELEEKLDKALQKSASKIVFEDE